jgi:hypothetical protein
MSARRHIVVALLLALIAFGGATVQASGATQAGSAESGLRLVCPLH